MAKHAHTHPTHIAREDLQLAHPYSGARMQDIECKLFTVRSMINVCDDARHAMNDFLRKSTPIVDVNTSTFVAWSLCRRSNDLMMTLGVIEDLILDTQKVIRAIIEETNESAWSAPDTPLTDLTAPANAVRE